MALVELDYMEVANDAAAQARYVTNSTPIISNANIDDEDMSDISDWNVGDTGTGVSSQVTFDGQETLKLDSGANTGSQAGRDQDIGALVNSTVLSVRLYHLALGTHANTDWFHILARHDDIQLYLHFASDGLFIGTGEGSFAEVGTDLVKIGEWQEWTFVCDFSTPASATCDIYLGGFLIAADVDCSDTGSYQDGQCILAQRNVTTANLITYVDFFKVGNGFTGDGALQCYSEDTIVQQGTYSLKAIASASALNKTLTRTI